MYNIIVNETSGLQTCYGVNDHTANYNGAGTIIWDERTNGALFSGFIVGQVIVTNGVASNNGTTLPAHTAALALTQDQINTNSLSYLSSTDWYAIRQAETGKPMPDSIRIARAAARAAVVRS